MRPLLAAILVAVAVAIVPSLDVPASPSPDGKALVVNLDKEKSVHLLQHWMEQAVGGLMAAVATTKLQLLPQHHKDTHAACAAEAKTVPVGGGGGEERRGPLAQDHATCVVALLDSEAQLQSGGWKKEVKRIAPPRRYRMTVNKRRRRQWKGRRVEWRGRRVKRWVVDKKQSYSLHSAPPPSPFAAIAARLTETVRELKGKAATSKNWNEVVADIHKLGDQLKTSKSLIKMLKKRMKTIQDKAGEGGDSRRPLAMKELEMFDDEDPKAMVAAAKKMESELSPEEKMLRQPLDLIRQAVKIGMSAAGGNVSNFDEKTLKMLSPRLMSVVPEEGSDQKEKDIRLLSPSLFSLHGEGEGWEKATNLDDPFGLIRTPEHAQWLNFVMEAAGVTDAVEMLKEEGMKNEMRSPHGQPLYFTRDNVTSLYGQRETSKIDIFEQLRGTFTPQQAEEQKAKGYFVMRPDQLRMVYGPRSPYHDPERLRTLSSVNTSEIPSHIDANIRALSNMSSFNIRAKDVFFTPVVLVPLIFQSALLSGPVILSPLVLSPSILSPAILGPVILGPWVFIPVILSPRVLSPLILNPLIFSPIILSPLVLHPLILSPGVFNPLILSPLVLSPFILSPQVFTPLILSPMVLNPLILTPMVLFAVVLSPYALSPLIQSELYVSAVVLSPSWLS